MLCHFVVCSSRRFRRINYIFSTFCASDNLFSRGVEPVDFSTLASFQRCRAHHRKMSGAGSGGCDDGVYVCAYVQTPNMQLTRCHSSSGSLVANSTKLHRVKHFIIQSECCSVFIHAIHGLHEIVSLHLKFVCFATFRQSIALNRKRSVLLFCGGQKSDRVGKKWKGEFVTLFASPGISYVNQLLPECLIA